MPANGASAPSARVILRDRARRRPSARSSTEGLSPRGRSRTSGARSPRSPKPVAGRRSRTSRCGRRRAPRPRVDGRSRAGFRAPPPIAPTSRTGSGSPCEADSPSPPTTRRQPSRRPRPRRKRRTPRSGSAPAERRDDGGPLTAPGRTRRVRRHRSRSCRGGEGTEGRPSPAGQPCRNRPRGDRKNEAG